MLWSIEISSAKEMNSLLLIIASYKFLLQEQKVSRVFAKVSHNCPLAMLQILFLSESHRNTSLLEFTVLEECIMAEEAQQESNHILNL